LVFPAGRNHLWRAVSGSDGASFWFSLTRWDLSTAEFIGLENFRQFFSEPFLVKGLVNTLIYAVMTSGLKTVCGLLLAVLLTSNIFARGFLRTVVFFPVLVSTIGIGITFTVMMHPTRGIINVALETLGIDGPGWLTNPRSRCFLWRWSISGRVSALRR
jgi:raffinose/stachyose/melibiose transport system permease protein